MITKISLLVKYYKKLDGRLIATKISGRQIAPILLSPIFRINKSYDIIENQLKSKYYKKNKQTLNCNKKVLLANCTDFIDSQYLISMIFKVKHCKNINGCLIATK